MQLRVKQILVEALEAANDDKWDEVEKLFERARLLFKKTKPRYRAKSGELWHLGHVTRTAIMEQVVSGDKARQKKDADAVRKEMDKKMMAAQNISQAVQRGRPLLVKMREMTSRTAVDLCARFTQEQLKCIIHALAHTPTLGSKMKQAEQIVRIEGYTAAPLLLTNTR